MTKKSRDRRVARRKLTKRTWHFIEKPNHFGIICPICSGVNLDWSEYNRHIWCYDCKKDLNNYESPMDGPVPVAVAGMLGINLHKWDMVNKRVLDPYGNPVEKLTA